MSFSRAIAAREAARRGGRDHDYREPQSQQMERREIQGKLRKLGAALDCRAGRKGTRDCAGERRAAVAAAAGSHSNTGHSFAVSRHHRKNCGLGADPRGQIPVCRGSDARRGARAPARIDDAARRRVRRNSRDARSAFRRRESRTHRAARRSAAARGARGKIRRGPVRGRRRRPHRRDGPRRNVHHAAPDFFDSALAPGGHARDFRRRRENFFLDENDRQDRRRNSAARCSRRRSASSTYAS